MSKYQKTKKEYDDKRAGKRTRNWTCILYPEDLPDDWIDRINTLCFKWVRSPLHEDFNEDGSPKKLHYHVMFLFEAVKNINQIESLLISLFGESENCSIIGVAEPRQVTDRGALIRYFAHLDNPEKVQYDVNDIVGYNGADVNELLQYSLTEITNKMIYIEEFIEENNITEYQELCKALRYDFQDLYIIVTDKKTFHFNQFIKSFRHKNYDYKINKETGEVIEK